MIELTQKDMRASNECDSCGGSWYSDPKCLNHKIVVGRENSQQTSSFKLCEGCLGDLKKKIEDTLK